MTVRQVHNAVSSCDYCSYFIFDRTNRVLCMPSTWQYVPDQLKDLEVRNVTASEFYNGNEKMIE